MNQLAPLSEAQEVVLGLLERTTVNNLDGPRIVAALRSSAQLWRSAYFTSIGIAEQSDGTWVFDATRQDLISLRDLPKGFLHFDSLLLLPVPGAQQELMELAAGWSADLVQWIRLAEAGRVMGGRRSVMEYAADPDRVILYLWWD